MNIKSWLKAKLRSRYLFIIKESRVFSGFKCRKIAFDPELPKDLMEKINHFALFTLSNYTYTTISLYSDFLTFETGFGEENIGRYCLCHTTQFYKLL